MKKRIVLKSNKPSAKRDSTVLWDDRVRTMTFGLGAKRELYSFVIHPQPEQNVTKILSPKDYSVIRVVKSVKRKDVMRVARQLKRIELLQEELEEIAPSKEEEERKVD